MGQQDDVIIKENHQVGPHPAQSKISLLGESSKRPRDTEIEKAIRQILDDRMMLNQLLRLFVRSLNIWGVVFSIFAYLGRFGACLSSAILLCAG